MEITSSRDGPFDVGDTIVDEYRVPTNKRTSHYVFENEDDETKYVIAHCDGMISCRVFGHDDRGIVFQYRFGTKHIEDWPEMNKDLKLLLDSFIVQKFNH